MSPKMGPHFFRISSKLGPRAGSICPGGPPTWEPVGARPPPRSPPSDTGASSDGGGMPRNVSPPPPLTSCCFRFASWWPSFRTEIPVNDPGAPPSVSQPRGPASATWLLPEWPGDGDGAASVWVSAPECSFRPRRQMAPRGHSANVRERRETQPTGPGFQSHPQPPVLCDFGQVASPL